MKTIMKFAAFFAILVIVPVEKVSAQQIYGMAVDVSTATTAQMFNCYTNYNYQTAFIRIYEPTGNGQVDYNGPTNIINANSANMGIEVFVTPNPTGSKQSYTQMDEAYTYVVNRGITLRSIWLQVTSPAHWYANQNSNRNFIAGFLQRAMQRGLGVGIYTNHYDWQQITGDWTGWQSSGAVKLWYWHVTGAGQSGATQPNFYDFTPFAGFTHPMVKQYAQNIYVCGTYVNLNAYALSKTTNFAAKQNNKAEKSDKIVVGQLFQN